MAACFSIQGPRGTAVAGLPARRWTRVAGRGILLVRARAGGASDERCLPGSTGGATVGPLTRQRETRNPA